MNSFLIDIARIWGVAGTGFLSGFIACFSHAGVPTLSIAPVDILVHEFKTMYNIGKATSPLLAVTATICNGFLAYQVKDDARLIGGVASPFALYLAAAICVPCIIPYTILYMEPAVNTKLLDMGAKVEKGAKVKDLGWGEEEVRGMLIRWRGMNFVRAGLVGIGCLSAAVAGSV